MLRFVNNIHHFSQLRLNDVNIICVLFLRSFFYNVTCGPYVSRNVKVCCRRSTIQHNSCCCYDHKDTYIRVNYPVVDPSMKFIDTEGLHCNGCELVIVC